MFKKVQLYTTNTCPYCVQLKQFLQENNIEFEDKNVSRDLKAREELLQKSGQLGVPVLDIDGEIIIGFDEEKIKEVLGL